MIIQRKQTGFTLLELMIVVAIAGILGVVAVPSLRDQILNGRVKSAAADAHLSLLLARSEAIKRSANIDMVDNGAGWNIQVQATSAVLHTKDDLTSNITVNCDTNGDGSADTCPASITFERTGRLDPTDSPFELWFYISGNSKIIMRCVSVSLSGRPRIEIDSDKNTSNGCS